MRKKFLAWLLTVAMVFNMAMPYTAFAEDMLIDTDSSYSAGETETDNDATNNADGDTSTADVSTTTDEPEAAADEAAVDEPVADGDDEAESDGKEVDEPKQDEPKQDEPKQDEPAAAVPKADDQLLAAVPMTAALGLDEDASVQADVADMTIELLQSNVYVRSMCETDDAIYYIEKTASKKFKLYTLKKGQNEPEVLEFSTDKSTTLKEMYPLPGKKFLINGSNGVYYLDLNAETPTAIQQKNANGSTYYYVSQAKDGNCYARAAVQMYRFDPKTASWTAVGEPNEEMSKLRYIACLGDTLYSVADTNRTFYALDTSTNTFLRKTLDKTETSTICALQGVYRASDNTLFMLAGLNTTDYSIANAVLLYTPQGVVEDLFYPQHMKTIVDFSDTTDATIKIESLLPVEDGKCYILAIKTVGETSSVAIYYFDGINTTELTYDKSVLSSEPMTDSGSIYAFLSKDGKMYVSYSKSYSSSAAVKGFIMRCTLPKEASKAALPTVTDVSASSPEKDKETTVTVSLKNDTNEAISELPICLKVDGRTIEDTKKLTLAAGAETTLSFLWTPIIGGNSALELWAGNSLITSKKVSVTELPIYDVAVSDIRGEKLYRGRTEEISVALKNNGNVIGDVVVTFYQGDTQCLQQTVALPLPGESTRVGDKCIIPNNGTFRVEAAFAEHEDSNPEDNKTFAELPVGKGIDAQWTSMSGVNGTFAYDIAGVEGGPIFVAYADNSKNGMLEYAGNGIWKNAKAPAANYYSIFMDSANSGWALAKNGQKVAMYQYDGDAWTQVSEYNMSMNTSYSKGRRGACKIGNEIYCLSSKRGTVLVYHILDNSWSTLTCEQMSSNGSALWASKEGKLYLAGEALYVYDGTNWTKLDRSGVQYIVGESDNDFYILEGQTLYHYDGKNFVECGLPLLNSSNKIAYCDGAVWANDPSGKGFFKYDGNEHVFVPCPVSAKSEFFMPLSNTLFMNDSGTIYYTGSGLEDLNGLEPADTERTVWLRASGTDFSLPLTKVTVTVPYDVATAIDNKDFTGVTNETKVNVTHALIKALHEQYGIDISDKAEGLEVTYQWGAYIRMLNGNTASGMSGWMYSVNGWIPNVGASGYDLWQGDQISWFWGAASSITTTDYGVVQADKSYIKPGDSIKFKTYDIKPSGSTQSAVTYQVCPVEKTLYVNASGKAYRTNSNDNYSIDITFNNGGTYQVSDAYGEVKLVTKTRTDGSKYVTAQTVSTDGIIGGLVPVEVTVLTGTQAEKSVITTDLKNTEVTSGQIAFLASTTDESKLVVKVNGKEQYNPVGKNRYVVNLLDGENIIELFAGDPNGVYSLERFTVTASGSTTGVMTVTTTAKTETVGKAEYSFAVEGHDYDGSAIKIAAKVNDVEILPEGKTYTATLKEGNNIIIINAESSTQWLTIRCVVTYDPSVEDTGTLREQVEAALLKTNRYVDMLTSPNEWNTFALDIQDGRSSGKLNALLQMVVTSADAKAGTAQEVVTDYAKWTLALRAAGGNPLAAVYGSSQYNLLDKIYNFPGNLYEQGINAPAWALIALDSGEYEVPEGAKYNREKLIDYLLKAQEDNGGWKLAASYSSADVDVTAMVLQALAPYQSRSDVKAAIDNAVNWLALQQNVKGQYESMGSFSLESIAQVIIALCANGVDPTGGQFAAVQGYSPVDALLKYALTDGSFEHVINGGTNSIATQQAHLAMIAYLKYLDANGAYNDGKTSIYYLGTNDAEDQYPPVISTSLKNSRVNGDSYSFTAAASDAIDGKVELIVVANDLPVEEVDGKYTVTLNKTGNKQTGIRLYAKDNAGNEIMLKYTLTYTEDVLVSAIELPARQTFTVGEGGQLIANVIPENAVNKTLEWKSSDESIASVDDTGKITAKKSGTAVITAYSTDGTNISGSGTIICKLPASGTDNTIRVTFSLLGDEAHGESTDKHTLRGGGLATWIEPTTIYIERGSTIGDVFKLQLAENGYTCVGLDTNYISSITTPDGETLAEFTNGTQSGWMYTINGRHLKLGLNDYTLKNGDILVWHYTDDYTKEEGSEEFDNDGGGGAAVDTKYTAADVKDLIDKIGTVTKDSKSAIEKAREAYDSLTAAQKKNVTNYDKLTAAEKKYTELTGEKIDTTKLPFTDVAKGSWYYDAIKAMYDKGLMNGESATKFMPNNKLSRAMLVTILYRMQNEPTVTANALFNDVADGQWYTKAVAWANDKSIVNGVGEGKFAPNDSVTRQEMAAMLYRYAKATGMDTTATASLNGFKDSAKVADWATDAMKWAVGSGLMKGNDDNSINPMGTATRAEVATVIMRLVENAVR